MVDETTGLNPEPNQGSDESTSEKPLTAKQINKMINDAFSARSKASEAKLETQLTELKALLTKEAPSETPAPSKKKVQEEDSAAVLALKAQVDKMTAATAKARANSLESAIKEACLAEKISADTVKALVPFLKQHIAYENDDSDNIVWRADDQELSLKEGVQNWVKNDPAANYFIQGKQVTGSGDTNYNNNSKQPSNETEASINRMLGLGR